MKIETAIKNLLNRYGHPNTEAAIENIVNTCNRNKEGLHDFTTNSEHSIGNNRIARKLMIPMEKDIQEIKKIIDKLAKEVQQDILSKTDEEGKTRDEYLVNIPTTIKLNTKTDIAAIETACNAIRRKFDSEGNTLSSSLKYENITEIMKDIATSPSENISNYTATLNTNRMSKYDDSLKFVEGQKASRCVQKIITQFGLDHTSEFTALKKAYANWKKEKKMQTDDWDAFLKEKGKELGFMTNTKKDRKVIIDRMNKNKKFTKIITELYDAMKVGEKEMKFIISTNPIDFLTMSFGRSWASCHTIDKTNKRRMENHYSGAYCQGTESYMLDGTSFITYLLKPNDDPEDYEKGKIYRCMFHYKDGMLVQGRVYPQGNDGNTDLYKLFRNAVQAELAAYMDIPDKWVKKSQSEVRVNSYGKHYKDYNAFNNCNVSFPSEFREACQAKIDSRERYMDIGHVGICTKCGEERTGMCSDRLHCGCR